MFKNVEELKQWLEDRDYEDVVIFEKPDYLQAIIGITEEVL